MLISPRTQIFFEDLSHISSRSHLEVMPDWPVPTVAVYEKVRGRLPFRMVLTLTVMALPSEVTYIRHKKLNLHKNFYKSSFTWSFSIMLLTFS